MIFPLLKNDVRISDSFGYGHYGASRGKSRTHKGTDFKASYMDDVRSPTDGIITKYGYAYSGDTSQRYVEITSKSGIRFRLFYVRLIATLNVGDSIKLNELFAFVGDIASKYNTNTRKMDNHIHLEIIDKGLHINPETFFKKKQSSNIKSLLIWLLVPSVFLGLYLATR